MRSGLASRAPPRGIADHVGARRHGEREARRVERRIALDLAEFQASSSARACRRVACTSGASPLEAEPDPFEIGVVALRFHPDPPTPTPSFVVCVTLKLSASVACAAQQHRRCRGQACRRACAPSPVPGRCRTSRCACRRRRSSARSARDIPSGSGSVAGSPACRSTLVDRLAAAIREHLLELAPASPRVPAEIASTRSAASRRRRAAPSATRSCERSERSSAHARGARSADILHCGSTLRPAQAPALRAMPFDCNGPTRPAASIVSIMRAARL